MTADLGGSAFGADVWPLRCFLAVADDLDFTLAGEHLGVARMHVAQQIGLLEERLGVALFRRNSRWIATATPAARALRPYVQRALDDLKVGVIAARAAIDAPEQLRVDILDQWAATPLLIVDQLRVATPGVEIQVGAQPNLFQRRKLQAGTIDVAFCRMSEAPGPSYLYQVVRREPVVCVLPVAHPLSAATGIALRELTAEFFYLPHRDLDPEWNQLIKVAFGNAGFSPRRYPSAVDDTEDTIIQAIGECRCVTLRLESARPLGGTIAVPLLDQPAVEYVWIMMWRKRGRDFLAVETVRSAARAAARTHHWIVE